jgi:hypothetical protein
MRSTTRLGVLCGTLLCVSGAAADITDTTPYDYDKVPKKGREKGTYMAAATGALGPECFFTFIGTAKYLPNRDGTGGTHCTKGNIELTGSGPLCAAFKSIAEPVVIVTEATYTYNGDGTLCEKVKLVGGQLDGAEFPSHTYVDPQGRWVFVTTQDIAYACSGGAASNVVGLNLQGPGFKISKAGDDPPGSDELPCTNP